MPSRRVASPALRGVAAAGSDGWVVVSLRTGVTLQQVTPSQVRLVTVDGSLDLPSLPPFIVDVLDGLGDGLTVAHVDDAVLDAHGVEGLAHWYAVLSLCEGAGVLRYDVVHDGRRIVTFTPAAPGRVMPSASPSAALRLSRFAHLRRSDRALMLESPLARGSVEIAEPQVALVVAALCVPVTIEELRERTGLQAEPWLGDALSLLVAAGMVLIVDADGATAEDRSLAAAHWEFHDLVLHARSRTSRVDQRVGGTYRLEQRVAPVPPLKAPMSGERIALARPDLDALAHGDMSLARAMEERRSIRRHGERPIDAAQLGEFLYRVARVRPLRGADLAPPRNQVRTRLYPGGGACHPLEIYPVISRCTGLEPGLHHYDPDAHALERLSDAARGAERLLRQTSVPMEGDGVPQVLLVLSARFRRLSWKYEGNAYALLLQEVGVLYQSMYLVATAMDLAPCAVGGGEAAHFAALIGTDPLEEASVGAFTLGSR